MEGPGRAKRTHRRRRFGMLILGTLLGAFLGLVYHDINPFTLDELPRSFEQLEFIARTRVRRVAIGALAGCFLGVVADVALTLYPDRRAKE
jgi:hypothetical protein